MSIINDALNKAIQEKDVKPETKSKTPPASGPTALNETLNKESSQENNANNKEPSKTKSLKFHLLVYIISLFAIALIGFAIFKYVNTYNYRSEMVSISEADKASGLSVITTGKKRAEASPYTGSDASGFLLTGIIHGEGASMAIINGSVYMAGDIVGSAKIAKINENTVIVEDGSRVLELKVK